MQSSVKEPEVAAAAKSLDQFTARQPIFDGERKVVAYELLFRNGPTNMFPAQTNPDDASASVIASSLSVFGLDSLLGNRQAFVNVTRRILIDGAYRCFPASRLVIELLETIRPDEETLRACEQAKADGYVIALDDFTDQPELRPFLPLVDMLKVDLRLAAPDVQRQIAERYGSRVMLLAEKVENEAEFAAATALGFKRFQGYFFCKPEIVVRKDIPSSRIVHLKFLRELARDPLDYRGLEQVIKLDVSLSVKLLRFLNTSSFGWRSEVTSIRQALTMLGEQPFRRWSSLLVMSAIADGGPAELLNTSLVRARFCELLATAVGQPSREFDLFLTGMLSVVDALVGRPLDELVDDLELPPEIACALTGRRPPSRLRDALLLVRAYERGAWGEVDMIAAKTNMRDVSQLPRLYQQAIEWANATTLVG